MNREWHFTTSSSTMNRSNTCARDLGHKQTSRRIFNRAQRMQNLQIDGEALL